MERVGEHLYEDDLTDMLCMNKTYSSRFVASNPTTAPNSSEFKEREIIIIIIIMIMICKFLLPPLPPSHRNYIIQLEYHNNNNNHNRNDYIFKSILFGFLKFVFDVFKHFPHLFVVILVEEEEKARFAIMLFIMSFFAQSLRICVHVHE